jgi:Arc/MetJ-type ribon-helix-helix transcriptional regulator
MFDASFYGENVAKNERIALRLESQLRYEAEKLIEAGKFKSLSQVVREALKQFLEKQKEGEA